MIMKPFGMAPKRRRSGLGMPPNASRSSVSVLAKRSPAKRSPFKRRVPGGSASNLALVAGQLDLGDGASDQPANIKVAVRVRPENEKEMCANARNIIDIVDEQMLVFDPKEDADDFFFHGRKQQRRDINKKVQRDQKFAFDVVYGPNSTNEDVFQGTTKDLIDVLVAGFNCSVFVYGATGSGKTHTMLGKDENPGITLRTVVELYKRIEEMSAEVTCEVMVSYLEIYNENVFDLINPGTQLNIREDGKAGVNIPGLSRHKPSGPDDLLKLLQFGNGNRTQHPTDANKESSRSHAVFQVFLKQTSHAAGAGMTADMKMAKLSMIDLAGSERGSATSSRGAARFREGANINKSLLALANCINALADGSKYIPYRNSKLTRLLKDSIGGNCRTVMISNISPSSLTYEDTYNTLKYADRAKKIKIRLKKNVVSVDYHVAQYAKIVEDLKIEIQQLKDKIAALEEENNELRSNQLQNLSGEVASTSSGAEASGLSQPDASSLSSPEVTSELEALRKQLSDYERRQKDFDDLQSRLDAFERDQLEKKPEPTTVQAAPVLPQIDERTERLLDEHKELMRKNFRSQSDLNLVQLQRQFHKRKFDRCSAIIPSETVYEAGTKKLKKFVSDLDRKEARLKKRNHQSARQFIASRQFLESEGCMSQPSIDSDLSRQKLELTNEHQKRMLSMMYDEQNRTESLLTESLNQLKRAHLLLISYGKGSEELNNDFDSLVSRIQCTTVQYRDTNLVETNEDTTSDRFGDFFAGLLDIEGGLEVVSHVEPESTQLNETVVVSSNGLVAMETDLPNLPDSDEDMVEDIEEDQPVWRPPTPPRSTTINTDQTPPSPKLTTVAFPKGSASSSAPAFSITDIVASPAGVNNGDATFCITSTQESEFDNASNFSILSSLIDRTEMTTADNHPPAMTRNELSASGRRSMRKSLSTSALGGFVDKNPASDDQEDSQMLTNYSSRPTPVGEVMSTETTFVVDIDPNPTPLNATVVISNNEDPVTSPEEQPTTSLDSTIVISKADRDVTDPEQERRRTFLLSSLPPSIISASRDDDKENFCVPVSVGAKVTSAPIAMVSPMTSSVTSTVTSHGGKKVLKKALNSHPIASTTNLRAVMDLKPLGHKTSSSVAPRNVLIMGSATSGSTATSAATAAPVLPSYMQLTAASRTKHRERNAALTASGMLPPRSRSPLEDRRLESNTATTPVIESQAAISSKNSAGPQGHPRMKKSVTTSSLRGLLNK